MDDINLDIVLEYFCIKKCVKAVCYKALKLYIFIWDNHNSYYLGSLIILVFLHYCYVYELCIYCKVIFVISYYILILILKVSLMGHYFFSCPWALKIIGPGPSPRAPRSCSADVLLHGEEAGERAMEERRVKLTSLLKYPD